MVSIAGCRPAAAGGRKHCLVLTFVALFLPA
jgi:hypothetical protein